MLDAGSVESKSYYQRRYISQLEKSMYRQTKASNIYFYLLFHSVHTWTFLQCSHELTITNHSSEITKSPTWPRWGRSVNPSVGTAWSDTTATSRVSRRHHTTRRMHRVLVLAASWRTYTAQQQLKDDENQRRDKTKRRSKSMDRACVLVDQHTLLKTKHAYTPYGRADLRL